MIGESDVIATVAEALMLEPEEIQMDTALASLPEYDSVSKLTLLVGLCNLADSNFEPSVIQSLKTCRDILALVNAGGL